jgi:hypothetical protein
LHSKLKYKRVYTNLQLQGVTQRFEDSIKLRKGSDDPKPARATREASTFQDLSYEMMTF